MFSCNQSHTHISTTYILLHTTADAEAAGKKKKEKKEGFLKHLALDLHLLQQMMVTYKRRTLGGEGIISCKTVG